MRLISLALALLLTGCDPSPAPKPSPQPSADYLGCLVTIPNSSGEPPFPKEQLFGYGSAYGNADLWVGGLPAGGVLAAEPEPDGMVGSKFGWFRIAQGTLEITARRLDGPTTPIDAHVPEGYGTAGFQATGIHFPAEGCWEVTGKVGSASLTWVLYVIKIRPS